MSPPQSASEVKSLLGMVQYVSRFIPQHAATTAPLRNLTKTHHAWKWDEEEQKTLDKLKQALTGERVITYGFDPRKETKIIVDGSPVGLGGLLAQDREIICYASCALSEIERRYSQPWNISI